MMRSSNDLVVDDGSIKQFGLYLLIMIFVVSYIVSGMTVLVRSTFALAPYMVQEYRASR